MFNYDSSDPHALQDFGSWNTAGAGELTLSYQSIGVATVRANSFNLYGISIDDNFQIVENEVETNYVLEEGDYKITFRAKR